MFEKCCEGFPCSDWNALVTVIIHYRSRYGGVGAGKLFVVTFIMIFFSFALLLFLRHSFEAFAVLGSESAIQITDAMTK